VVGNLLPHERSEQPRVVCDLHHRRPHRRDEHVYRDPLVWVRDRGARLVGEASDVREAGPACGGREGERGGERERGRGR